MARTNSVRSAGTSVPRPCPAWLVGFSGSMLLGVMTIPTPFTGDQALFSLGARVISDGGVYYRDFWDVKQPGIMHFYRLAQPLGGGPVAMHLVELAWMAVLVVLILAVMRRHTRTGAALAVAPLLSVGALFALVEAPGQTLIESLNALPLFVVLLATLRLGEGSGRRDATLWAVGAGLATGVVGLFKLVHVAVAVAIWLAGLFGLRRSRSAKELVRLTAVAVGGSLMIVLPFVGHFVAVGVGGLVWDTTFVYPPRITQIPGFRAATPVVEFLGSGARRYGWLAIPAVAGIVAAAKNKRRITPLRAGLAVWIVAGIPVILIQKWNPYQFQLLVVPAGLLAALALDDLLVERASGTGSASASAKAVVAATLLAAVPAALLIGEDALVLARHGFGVGEASAEAYRRDSVEEYRIIEDEVARVAPIPPGTFYVLGHPLYYLLCDRQQALALNGWSTEQWLDEQWAEFVDEMALDPPDVLFVDSQVESDLDAHPAARAAVEDQYVEFDRTPTDVLWGGRWLRLSSR